MVEALHQGQVMAQYGSGTPQRVQLSGNPFGMIPVFGPCLFTPMIKVYSWLLMTG
jgi:hypothetical protein